jgi:hypothetical protein
MSDHDFWDRWRAADRVPDGITQTDASRDLMDQIRAGIVASERPVRKPRRFRVRFPAAGRGVALGSVVGLLAVGGAAAATLVLTGGVMDGASGSCQTLMNATANVPYPAGDQAWRNWALLTSPPRRIGTTLQAACNDPSQQSIGGPHQGHYAESIPVFQGVVASSAFCAWADTWLIAERSGDTASEAQAASEIAGALQWPASKAFLQPNSANGPLTGGPGMLGWVSAAQQAVQAGNVTEVASMFASPRTIGSSPIISECSTYAPPASSHNGTVRLLYPWENAQP